jgi:hypothetical protein
VKVEVIHLFPDSKASPTSDEGSIATVVTFDEENLLP